jgi:hypothetical protein
LNNIIPIDFVPGSHGHFLEVTLNKFFGFTSVFDSFTPIGTSHVATPAYLQSRVFDADHWYRTPEKIQNVDKIISIRFSHNSLLLLSSLSLLRSTDRNIDNDQLEVDTYNKLNNPDYKNTLDSILQSYPFLSVDQNNSSIPRNVLREFYKFGFADHTINGLWIEQQNMKYSPNTKVFYFDFENFYKLEKFNTALIKLEQFIGAKFNFCSEFVESHTKFLSFISYQTHKEQCDQIVQSIVDQTSAVIPSLTLFQESYINARLEKIYKKEMPFHDQTYFTSTEDVLQYIMTKAPDL